jgi:ATP-binding cassette subfamily B protein
MAVKGIISVGTFFLFYTYLSMMIYPLLDLPQLFVSGKQAFVNIDRLEEMRGFPTFYQETDAGEYVSGYQSLEFRNVSFRYPSKPDWVFEDVSFKLDQHEKMLILGATGAGKSTITKLILGLALPTSGSILVNDKDVNSLNIRSLRDVVAYVPQEPALFSGSIRENILLARPEASEADYAMALDTAQLRSEIDQFPERDDTKVGQRGLEVSGGQKQRITIARALIKKPRLLILDDITASLDAENEEKLWNALQKNYPGTSAIVISQRLSTLRYVDTVLFIDQDGKAHKGTHDELVFCNQEYHDFLHEHLKK